MARASHPDQRILAQTGRALLALITERRIRRGINRSVAALRADITAFIDHHNAEPRPFRWTKSANDLLASIERFCRYNTPVQS
jgi:hypothetical protein